MERLIFASPVGFLRERSEISCANDAPVADEMLESRPTEWIIARHREILIRTGSRHFLVERPILPLTASQTLGTLNGQRFVAGAVALDTPAPRGHEWVGLRSLCGVLDDARVSLAGRAVQLLDWELDHAFCGRCGAQTILVVTEGSRQCSQCQFVAYPRLEPATIVAVVRPPGEILLARTSRLPSGIHSVLAGFVEPGETLEQCAEREVFEESHLRIKNLQYVGSQPWPFPRSLMIGFIAEYASGELRIDSKELESADWFPFDKLPPLPSEVSISRALIEVARSQFAR